MNGIGTGRPGFPRHWGAIALVALGPAFAGGCKMGTAGTKPSWWAFGSAPNSSAEKLAAAPSFAGGVEKPSATAQPYPTTSTPNSYALDGASKDGGPAVAAATATPAAVTYGVTPPPARPDPVALATSPASGAATADASAPPLTSITPQVGPYAGLPAEPPTATAANAELPPLQAVAGEQQPPMSAFGAGLQPNAGFATPAPTTPEPQRVADARGSNAWPAPPAGGSRYDGNAPSRFGSPAAIDQPLPSSASAAALPAALDPLPPAAAPAAAPSGFQPPPAAVPAPTAPGSPVRRPDPVYRPGGTSSYRPSRAILAGDAPGGEPGAVRPVGFETPAGETP